MVSHEAFGLTGHTEASRHADVRTYTMNNRRHGVCDLFGSVGVAHGSALELLQERLWKAGWERCGFSPSLSHWDSGSFWAA